MPVVVDQAEVRDSCDGALCQPDGGKRTQQKQDDGQKIPVSPPRMKLVPARAAGQSNRAGMRDIKLLHRRETFYQWRKRWQHDHQGTRAHFRDCSNSCHTHKPEIISRFICALEARPPRAMKPARALSRTPAREGTCRLRLRKQGLALPLWKLSVAQAQAPLWSYVVAARLATFLLRHQLPNRGASLFSGSTSCSPCTSPGYRNVGTIWSAFCNGVDALPPAYYVVVRLLIHFSVPATSRPAFHL